MTTHAPVPLWIGTYPHAGIGTPAGLGEGVWRVDLDPATGRLLDGRLVVRTPAPTFLAADPAGRVLLGVDESAAGTVTAWDVTADGGLAPRATVGSGGAHPCHLLRTPQALYVANYSDGALGVLPLAADGGFAPEVLAAGGAVQRFEHAGSGPVADRQGGPHAHFAALTPDGRHLLVADLGTDELRRYARAADGSLADAGVAATLPPGTGPRHLAFSADGTLLHVAGELDATLHVLAWDAATATGTPRAVLPAAPDHDGGAPAHVLRDGDRLLMGVRGVDVLTTWTLGPDGTPGTPAVATLPGRTPRHHEVVAGWTVVALQEEHLLVVLDRAGAEVGRLELPSPACIVPVTAV